MRHLYLELSKRPHGNIIREKKLKKYLLKKKKILLSCIYIYPKAFGTRNLIT